LIACYGNTDRQQVERGCRIKVQFSHQLILNESPVLEVLALWCALLNPDRHADVLDLQAFAPELERHAALATPFAGRQQWHFAWLEFALVCPERQNLDTFLAQLHALEAESFLRMFLQQDIDAREARAALAGTAAMEACLVNLKLEASLSPLLLDTVSFRTKLALALQDLWANPAFSANLQELRQNGEYRQRLNAYADGMSDRHPLSYAQELMGKPFWNIADYRVYEFLPLHYISPFRLRLMDGDTMIYVDGLKRMARDDSDRQAALFDAYKILGDSTRLKILQLLYMKPMYGKEIATVLNLTTATISHHLEALSRLGLLNMEQVRQLKYFSTNLRGLRSLQQELESIIKNRS